MTETLSLEQFIQDYEGHTGKALTSPVVMSKSIDLYLLLKSVMSRGGYQAV
jgi:hypothetical protein